MSVRNKHGKESSSSVAKDRIKIILESDRLSMAPARMDQLKKDLMEVLAKYVEYDKDNIMISVDRQPENTDDDVMAVLIANAPIKKVKRH